MKNLSLALIAGSGDFPFLFIEELRHQNQNQYEKVIIIALHDETSPQIEACGFPVFWTNVGKLDTIISIMKENKINQMVMCGRVKHTRLFTEVKLDFRAVKFLGSLINKKADTILDSLATEFSNEGIEMISSVSFMQRWMPTTKGSFLQNKISSEVMADIEFGFDIAKKVASLDIGQTVVVKDKAIVAVEGLEGTDKCMLRAYELAGEGVVVAKVNKPNQDLRFDVPVIGKRTFDVLAQIKASAICFEAGKTLFFDEDYCLELAKKNNISIYAF